MLTITTATPVRPLVAANENLPPNLAPDVAQACRSFIWSSDEGLGRHQKRRAVSDILAARPDTPADIFRGLETFVNQVGDDARQGLRLDHAVKVLRDNPALDAPTFLEAVDGTIGSYAQSDAAARLDEGIAEYSARRLFAGQPAAPAGTSCPGITMDIVKKLDDDPLMKLVNQAGSITSSRLAHFHAALDGDQKALFSQEHALYSVLKSEVGDRHDGLVAGLAMGGIALGIFAAALPLPDVLKIGGVMAGMVTGLIAAGVTRRVIDRKAADKVEQKMRQELAPQRQWWDDRAKALAPLHAEVREATLQRLCSEASTSPPADPGHVVVGDGSVDLGGIKVGRRPGMA